GGTAMPTFDTPKPISVTVDVLAATVRITAGDRPDTVVEVRPGNPAREVDVVAAAETRVEVSNDKLLVKAPRLRPRFDNDGSIEVTIELPTDSRVHGEGAAANFSCEGQLGECEFKTSSGDLALDRNGAARLDTTSGDVSLNRVFGDVEVTAGS